MAQNGSNSSQNGSNSSQTQNGSNSSQTHLKNSKWLKMAQTHLKSFNGRQGGILQSISGVSGASGGLRSQIFGFLTKKKFLRKCSYLRNQTSHRVGSGVKTTVGPRATHMTLQIKCTSSSFHDRLSFIKHL